MKSIGINSYNRDLLKKYTHEKVSYDGIVNRLINDVGDQMPHANFHEGKQTAIKLHEDTLEKLRSYALTSGESYENILIRMMIMSKDLNTDDE